jgi:hypothetical protein
MTMKPADTVITKDGKEGIVSLIVPATQWVSQRLVYVDFEKPNPHWNIFLESELKVKEEINENTNRTSSQRD